MSRTVRLSHAGPAVAAALLLAGLPLAGCAPKEEPPATPPALPPVPPRPANQGASADRYNQLMNQSGGQKTTPADAMKR